MWILTRVTFFQQRAFLSKMMSENINPALISHDMILLVNTGGCKFYNVTATEALMSVMLLKVVSRCCLNVECKLS